MLAILAERQLAEEGDPLGGGREPAGDSSVHEGEAQTWVCGWVGEAGGCRG